MRISSAKKTLKEHVNIKKRKGNGNNASALRKLVNRWPAIGGDYTIECESINSPQSQFYADEHHEYLNGEGTKKICFR